MVIARPMGFGTGIVVGFRHGGIARLCDLANHPGQGTRQPRTVVVAGPCLFVEPAFLHRRAPEWVAADWQ